MMDTRPANEEISGTDPPPGFAAVAHELAAADDMHADVHVNGKRKRPAGAAEGTGDQQVTGGDHQEPLDVDLHLAGQRQGPVGTPHIFLAKARAKTALNCAADSCSCFLRLDQQPTPSHERAAIATRWHLTSSLRQLPLRRRSRC